MKNRPFTVFIHARERAGCFFRDYESEQFSENGIYAVKLGTEMNPVF